MDKPTTLHRSDTFPYDKNEPDYKDESRENYTEHFETGYGWYRIRVDLITDNFELKTPKGLVLEDCLADMHKRKNLYAYMEDGAIYEWIWHVRDVITRARMAYGESNSWFIIDGVKYRLRINTDANEVLLTIPTQTRAFSVKNVFLSNPDIPLVQEGLLVEELRKRLEHKGYKVPRTPYQVALGISMKAEVTNTPDV